MITVKEHKNFNSSQGYIIKEFKLLNSNTYKAIKYKIINLLGKGSFGEVYLIETDDKQLFALKTTLETSKATIREVQILKSIKNKNIIRAYAYSFKTNYNNQKCWCGILMEYCTMSLKSIIFLESNYRMNLLKYYNEAYSAVISVDNQIIKKRSFHSAFKESASLEQHIIKQLLEGLNYLHDKKICHRDLKPSNILISENYHLKICDLGSAKKLIKNVSLESNVCTPLYRAPEIFLKSEEYTTKVDIWSAGVIIVEIVTSHKIFYANDYDVLSKIKYILDVTGQLDVKCKKNNNILCYKKSENETKLKKFLNQHIRNRHLIDLIEKMLQFDPENRISAKEALEHKYFTSLKYKEV